MGPHTLVVHNGPADRPARGLMLGSLGSRALPQQWEANAAGGAGKEGNTIILGVGVWSLGPPGEPHLLKEERQLVTMGGQPLWVQRPVET